MNQDEIRKNAIMVPVPSSYIKESYVGHYLKCPSCGDLVFKGPGYGKCACGNISVDSDMLRVSLVKSSFSDIEQYWKVDPFKTCPVCGFQGLSQRPYKSFDLRENKPELKPPYEEYFGEASYEVCECCGFEFGNDDNPGTAEPVSFMEFRQDWIAGGASWFKQKKKSKDWTLIDQLTRAGMQ